MNKMCETNEGRRSRCGVLIKIVLWCCSRTANYGRDAFRGKKLACTSQDPPMNNKEEN